MIAILEETVDVPLDRRLSLELPKTVPVGKNKLVVYLTEVETVEPPRLQPEYVPTIEELKADAEAKYAARMAGGEDALIKWRDSLGHKIFDCKYNYQRSIRDEWED